MHSFDDVAWGADVYRRLEGIRDGIEDLELYKMLSSLVNECNSLGVDTASEASALTVPDALLTTVSNDEDPSVRMFAEDPYALRAQWRRVVAGIKSLQVKRAAAAAAAAVSTAAVHAAAPLVTTGANQPLLQQLQAFTALQEENRLLAARVRALERDVATCENRVHTGAKEN